MITFEKYVEKANIIHNNKYEYVRDFKKDNGNRFFEIVCSIHGSFEKKIVNHINKKQGCPLCSKPSKLNDALFIEKALKIHNDIYDYSQVIYTIGKEKVKIICKEHGLFEQTPNNHLRGQGCPNCGMRLKLTNETFIKKAQEIHGNKYDYSEIDYVNNHTEIKINCRDHGIFYQMPLNHLKGNQCYKCSNIIRNNDDFINKANIIHKNIYDYSKTVYISARNKVIITCKSHGDFKQSPNDHINGCGCQKCSLGNFSKVCMEWLENIMKKENIYIQHAGNVGEKEVFLNNKKFRFDGFCEETNTVYEFYGDFWHGNPKVYNLEDIHPLNKKTFNELYTNTLNREKLIIENGYNLITVWENEYKKL